ncbi:MAG: hypothetical protein R2748_16060 [Bryobacterales bacterium]
MKETMEEQRRDRISLYLYGELEGEELESFFERDGCVAGDARGGDGGGARFCGDCMRKNLEPSKPCWRNAGKT